MCGLVGIMSSNTLQKHKDALSTLLYLDTFRGRDSTGVAAVRWNGDTHTLKQTVPGYEFVEGPQLHAHLKLNDFLWIGHNRFGTVGKNCKSNAHPFQAHNDDDECLIVGAHNGTLKNKHDLTDHLKYGTDSEALMNEIANIGIEAALKKADGAWALTYYDHMEDEFRIIRNKERPLFYAWSEDKHTLLWASEIWMLRVASSRHDIKLFEDKVWQVLEDTLYSFPRPNKMNDEITMTKKGGVTGKEVTTFFQRATTGGAHSQGAQTTGPSVQGLPGLPAPIASARTRLSVVSNSGSGTPTKEDGEKQLKTSGTASQNLPATDSGASVKGGTPAISTGGGFWKGYNGARLTLAQLKDDLSAGCSWCELEFIDVKDRFAWMAPGKPVCHKCLTGEDATENDNPILLAAAGSSTTH